MDTFTLTAKELHEIQQKIKFLKDKEKDTTKRLRDICSGQSMSVNGYTYALIERKGSVKYKDIPELKDYDLEPFRGDTVITWKLSYTKQYNI